MAIIDIVGDLLQDVVASIAFRVSQAFHLSDRPKANLVIQFVIFALLFVGLIGGTLWLLFRFVF
jgi:hypothetical protein